MANGKRDAGKEALWREVLARQAESGLSVAEFCRREKLGQPSFYAWRRALAVSATGSLRNRRRRGGRAANSCRCG
jgi:hypothetical protein